LYTSFETDKRLNEIPFEQVNPLEAGLNAINQAIEQLNHLALSANVMDSVIKWRQVRTIAAPFIQQQRQCRSG
jgi:hypothetical protein